MPGDRTRRFLSLCLASSPLGRVVTVLVCLFLGFCTSVGTLFRGANIHASISGFGFRHWLLMLAVAGCYWLLVAAATGAVRRRRGHENASVEPSADGTETPADGNGLSHAALWVTRSWNRLFALFLVGWAWVPLFLRASFGYDLTSQTREVGDWLTLLRGGTLPTGDGKRLPIFDVYPIGHYLLPPHPVALSDQHNLLLTLLSGLTENASLSLTGSMLPGAIVLGLLQYVFAAFCCAAIMTRLVRLDPALSAKGRTLALSALLLSPMVCLSTVQLTKSPLFGFASAWMVSVLLEATRTPAGSLPRRSRWALALSSLVCLLSAKYGVYIVLIEAVVLLVARRHAWKQWLVCLAVPLLVFETATGLFFWTGQAVHSDPIEGKGVQLQQIARIAAVDPGSLPASTRKGLAPIVSLDGLARAYFPNDADRVKSSGSDPDKTVGYRWRSVTRSDMRRFNRLWLEAVRANPRVATDAFIAEFYGYFDICDRPYVAVSYYLGPPAQASGAPLWLGLGGSTVVRDALTGFEQGWSFVPVIGWPAHGNLWVILTLLALCVQMRLRRWDDLLWMLPLVAQMGVMALSPANNFDRHMIGIAVFAPVLLADLFARGDRSDRQTS